MVKGILVFHKSHYILDKAMTVINFNSELKY